MESRARPESRSARRSQRGSKAGVGWSPGDLARRTKMKTSKVRRDIAQKVRRKGAHKSGGQRLGGKEDRGKEGRKTEVRRERNQKSGERWAEGRRTEVSRSEGRWTEVRRSGGQREGVKTEIRRG